METTEIFSINSVGDRTKRIFSGTFTVKTILSRQDQFIADAKRREILGPNSQDALDILKVEAWQFGQLYVRIIKAPQFWADSNNGLLLEDYNIIQEIYTKCVELEQKSADALKDEAQGAKKDMVNKDKQDSAKV